MKRVIGVDPGSTKVGYGILDVSGNNVKYVSSGSITLKPSKAYIKRLVNIHIELDKILAKFLPDDAAIEDVFFAKNPKSALRLGEARGAALLTLARQDLTVSTYPARFIKKAITGYGNASKEQVEYMIKVLLKLKDRELEEDEADALAVAYCHILTSRPKSILKATR